MRKTIDYCDIYGTEGAELFAIFQGAHFDGVETVDDYYRIDLGFKATVELLKYIQNNMLTQAQRDSLVKHLNSKRKTVPQK